MAVIKPVINNEIYSWALNRAGVSLMEATAVFPKLEVWMSGKELATVNQLKKFALKYHFPFGYFFLDKLPDNDKIEIPFFRSNDDFQAGENLAVIETIKILKNRQQWMSEYLKDNGLEENTVIGKYKNESNPVIIANGIKEYLNLEYDWNLKLGKSESPLKIITNKLEEKDIVVVFNSVVNNNTHRPIPVKLCRGFCLIDKYVPFIFINSSDSKSAQLFTLIHELAHIFISFSSGIGDLGINKIEDARESLCDKVAANLLVPEDLLIARNEELTNEALNNENLAKLFKVSEIVILRRKLDCGLISKEEFISLYNALPVYKKEGNGRADFYKVSEKRIGPQVLRCIYQAMMEQLITPMEAYGLAGVNGNVFHQLINGERYDLFG